MMKQFLNGDGDNAMEDDQEASQLNKRRREAARNGGA